MVVVCPCQLAMVVATRTVGPEDLPYTTYHFPSPRLAPVVRYYYYHSCLVLNTQSYSPIAINCDRGFLERAGPYWVICSACFKVQMPSKGFPLNDSRL